MKKKCKVKGCKNSVMEIRDSARAESMKGKYGYCQIHNIEGTVQEVPTTSITSQSNDKEKK